jgi:hypothetical protein
MPIAGPSKIFGLESTGKFPRFRAPMVSVTIDVDWLNNSSGRAFPSHHPALQYPQCGAPAKPITLWRPHQDPDHDFRSLDSNEPNVWLDHSPPALKRRFRLSCTAGKWP